MYDYSDFSKDFVKRTKENLECIEQTGRPKHETTCLINMCLGLIAVPDQFLCHSSRKGANEIFTNISNFGLNDANIISIRGSKSVRNVLHHLRNGLMHGHIEQQIDDRQQIVGLRIKDVDKKGYTHTEIELTIEQLRQFALAIATAYCETFPNTNE